MTKQFKLKKRVFKGMLNSVFFRTGIALMVLFLLTSMMAFLFSIGTTDILEYALSFEAIQTRETVIERDATGYYSIKVANEADTTPIKILQLTDIHLGNGVCTQKQDRYAINAVYKVVKAVEPDLIMVTGDSVYPVFIQTMTSNNLEQTKVFCNMMESIGIPWAYAYGNHDEEVYATHRKSSLTSYYQSISYENGGKCLFTPEQRMIDLENDTEFEMYGEFSGDVYGDSNYFINVLNSDSSLNTTCLVIDSNMYIEGSLTDGYDNIHEDQIEWYEKELTRVSNCYNAQDGTSGLANSLAFYHIPSQEYYDVWNALEKQCTKLTDEWGTHFAEGTTENIDGNDVYYHYGYMGEGYRDNGEAIISDAKYSDLFFEKLVELGSTKATFVGHDHKNTYSVTYKGIILNFGLSIDNLAYVDVADYEYRGGTIIELDDFSADGVWNMTISQLKLSDIVD
ncbi:MAG: metallophosphoesterase [Clostridia bacterium]|nr:metallophosphoesterase [Clostridia bacterium]